MLSNNIISFEQLGRTNDFCMILQMASLKFYIVIIVTLFILALFHYPKYFQPPVWQDFTVVDNQGKTEVRTPETAPELYFCQNKKMNQS